MSTQSSFWHRLLVFFISVWMLCQPGLPVLAASADGHDVMTVQLKQQHRITNAQRHAAAARAAANGSRTGTANAGQRNGLSIMGGLSMGAMNMGGMPSSTEPDFFNVPNWANSPLLRKFVDRLPGLGEANANALGQYLPVAVPDQTTYLGSDYYEIGLVQYKEQMHSDLPATLLRGYVQLNDPAHPATKNANGKVIAWPKPHYLGPIIVAQKNRPVRVKFTNLLPTGTDGDLFIPVDTTMMGAGMGPYGMNPPVGGMNYTQNRGTLHLHGGNTPWISDGTPHQWVTPAGEVTSYPKGVSVQNVPDMPDPGDGSMTFFYTNQQSARLLFYHDHAYGITRLNVYAGEAAGYLITDPTEQDLVNRGIIPSEQIPLIIQDKTFVDASKVLTTDPTWQWGSMPGMPMTGDLWWPHVYMPNQNPWSDDGVNPFGRWDYGPWFWPPWPVNTQPIPLDPNNPNGPQRPGVPNVSMTMEAFHDTPLVNGTAYPYLEVQPKAYRFRILNASNDRFWNLQLHQADSAVTSSDNRTNTEISTVEFYTGPWPAGWPTPDLRASGVPDPTKLGPNMIQIGTEGGFLPAPVVLTNIPIGYDRDVKSITVLNVKEHNLLLGPAERADVIIDFSAFAGKTLILYNDAPAACPASDSRVDYYTGDGDQTDIGGAPNTEPGFGPNTRTIMQIRVADTAAAPAFNSAALNAEFASTATKPGVFVRSQNPIIVPQVGYNSAYNANFPKDRTAYVRLFDNSLTFTPLGAANPLTLNFKPKAIAEEFEAEYGRMSGFLGVEVPFTNGQNQTTIWYGYIDPFTESITDSMTPLAPAAGDGTQIWKITHNGVDTHPVHFHLFDVQLINRVDWGGVVKPPEPNELGWKDTVRMNPLEDCIVALRPVAPKLPFGVPESIRPLDPTMPLDSSLGFKGVDPLGNPITVTNVMTNFGWEYVWHCHILSHEEMDMMRPVSFLVATVQPAAPSGLMMAPDGTLSWVDSTPAATALGNPQNEIGFRIIRSVNNGAFQVLTTALANATSFKDTTIQPSTKYTYKVIAFNASGETTSTGQASWPTPPAPPTNVAATVAGTTSARVSFTAPVLNGGSPITGYRVTVSPSGATVTGATSPITVANLTSGNTYTFTVQAITSAGTSVPSAPSNSVTLIGANLVSDIASPILMGQTVQFTASLIGITGVAEYKCIVGTTVNGVTTYPPWPAQYSVNPTYTWTPAAKGSYVVKLAARKVGTTTLYQTTMNMIVVDPMTAVSLNVTPVSPTLLGTNLTAKATVTGGAKPEYKFVALYTDTGGTTVTVPLQSYGTAATWTGKLPIDAPRTYSIVVYAREQGTVVDYLQTAAVTMVTKSPLSALAISVTPSSPITLGTTITMKGIPTGGAKLEYKFIARYTNAAGTTITVLLRDYAASDTWAGTLPTDAPRTYSLQVWAREQGTTVSFLKNAVATMVVK